MQQIFSIAGVDEVGMGCLAGPVVAAAVMFRGDIPVTLASQLDDSKKLKSETREKIFTELYRLPQARIGVSAASVQEIFSLNIRNAAHLAMKRALGKLSPLPDLVLIDGNNTPDLGKAVQAIVKGDGLSFSIAAASIIAKVVRDRLMHRLSRRWNHYGWEQNVGYPTVFHRQALARHGCSPHHRQGYITVKQLSFDNCFPENEFARMARI